MNTIKTYSELILIPTFEGRFEYLRLNGLVGESTFGSKRYLNQILYKTSDWKRIRDQIIIRDNGCDLAIEGREIYRPLKVLVHHLNPITIDDVLNGDRKVFDPENLITISLRTHNALHYGNEDLLIKDPIERKPNDTIPWRR